MNAMVELKIPPSMEYAALLDAVVSDAAVRGELDPARSRELREAAKLGFELIVRDAMAEDREPIRISASCTPEEVRISLLERGLPLDERSARRDPNWDRILTRVDAACWKLHGTAGSELQLGVKLPHILPEGELPEPPPQEVPLAPEQRYTIRRFVPEDAAGVARAFYLTWGYHYIFPAVYVPRRLIALNERNEYISMVAVAEDGEIVGHYALDPVPGAPIADACAAIVNPAHRGRELLIQMRRAAEDEAIRLGMDAYYSEPVTTHGRTQSESMKFGAKLCGIVLGGDPATFVPKHMQITGAGQRQSFTVYFKPLSSRETRTIFAPARHREMIGRIYESLGLPVEFAAGTAPSGAGELHTSAVRGEGFATIEVRSAGAHSAAHLAQAVEDLRALGHIGALYALLPLEDPATPQLCEAAESMGFVFSGIVPWWFGGRDALRLQMPLTPIDLDQVTIVGEFGQELLAYIGAQLREVQAKSASAAT